MRPYGGFCLSRAPQFYARCMPMTELSKIRNFSIIAHVDTASYGGTMYLEIAQCDECHNEG